MSDLIEFLIKDADTPPKYEYLTKEDCDYEKVWKEWSTEEMSAFLSEFGPQLRLRHLPSIRIVLVLTLGLIFLAAAVKLVFYV